MALEYAIFDDQGKQFGLPARSWPDKAAAQSTLDYLCTRRQEMEREAHKAQLELNTHTSWDNWSGGREQELKETIERWVNEQPRVYHVLQREVGAWEMAR